MTTTNILRVIIIVMYLLRNGKIDRKTPNIEVLRLVNDQLAKKK